MPRKPKPTTLIRIKLTTLETLRDLKDALGIRYDCDIVEIAIKTLATAHDNKMFDLMAGKVGVVYAKRKRR
jgi:hypothetical protein